MGSLYERLEETEYLLAMLTNDLNELHALFADASITQAPTPLQEAAKRSYVRAFFALVEALTEQYARLLVALSREGFIRLAPETECALSDQTHEVLESGKIRTRPMRVPIKRRLLLLYRVAAEALGQELDVRFEGAGWQDFGKALEYRHALTHPKHRQDCYVDESELAVLDSALDWYKHAHNRLVSALRAHRDTSQW